MHSRRHQALGRYARFSSFLAARIFSTTTSIPFSPYQSFISLGPYLVLATKTVVVGTLFGAKIEKITKVALVPVSRRVLDSSEAKAEQKYLLFPLFKIKLIYKDF